MSQSSMKMRVRSRDEVAEGVVGLALEPVDGSPLPAWAPGAHIDLVLDGDLVRQYSLCGDPADVGCWRIAVLRDDRGRGGSLRVHRDLVPGREVDVTGPRNHFPLVEGADYLFVAGGIGITPLLPMIREAEARGASWRLAYGGRTRGSMAYADGLVADFGDRVTLHPQDEVGLLDLAGLLGDEVPGRQVYCCGPEPLLQAIEAAMGGRAQESLHLERFSPKELAAAASGEFEVRAAASGVTVTVAADESIIDALDRVGIAVDFSCQEGTCGTCETSVLGGVPEHRDSVLSAEEQAENDCMMICVGRCLEGPLVLDL